MINIRTENNIMVIELKNTHVADLDNLIKQLERIKNNHLKSNNDNLFGGEAALINNKTNYPVFFTTPNKESGFNMFNCEYCENSYLSGDEIKCIKGNDQSKHRECEDYDLDSYFKQQET